MVKNRGQVSIEYLIVVGMVIFFVISMMGVAYYYSNNIKDQMRMTQLQNFMNKVITSAETVYYSGEPSKVTINAYLPAGVNYLNVFSGCNGLYVKFQISSGENIQCFESNVNIEIYAANPITITEGLKRISIIAENDKVVMEQV